MIISGDMNVNALDDKKYKAIKSIENNFYLCNDSCPTYHVSCFTPSLIDLFFVKNAKKCIKFGHFPVVGISSYK